MLSRFELRDALQELDAAASSGAAISAERARELAPAAEHWAEQSRQVAPLRRLARALRLAGDVSGALALFARAHEIDPADIWSAVGLSSARESLGDVQEALRVIEPSLDRPDCDAALLLRGAVLSKKLGGRERSLALRRRAAARDKGQLGGLIAELTVSGCADEALEAARRALGSGIETPDLAFHCYAALRKFSSGEDEILRARDLLMALAAARSEESIWRARLYRREGRLDEALAEISHAVSERPDDLQLIRERASIALACGYWGRDARPLLDARAVSGSAPELRGGIDLADELLRAHGGSLESAVGDPEQFAQVRSPESVFELLARTLPVRADPGGRSGIVMIASSLAAGGAERILATAFRHISQDKRFGWAKLYLFDLSPENATDFYLPLTGLSHSEVILLSRECQAEAPLSWLPAGKGKIAQSIRNRLEIDRPAIVHAWLEPLNTLAGLAALVAGVPRIVLHTHNMRPGELNPDDSFVPRMRDCYRALLGRPEVSLICCAKAAVNDYGDWIGLDRRANISAVHNGLSSDLAAPAREPELRAEVRREYGVGAAPLLGTAFRFSEVKRPFRWVDSAAMVLERRPDCRFIMFGDGELRIATEEYIRSKGLSGQFILPGLVSDLYRRLPALDLFLLSSRTEALPNVLLEAQNAGVPVVAYNIGGVAETMIDGVTGHLVNEDSAAALADAALQALGDGPWRTRAGAAGKTFVAENFSIDGMMRQLSEILVS